MSVLRKNTILTAGCAVLALVGLAQPQQSFACLQIDEVVVLEPGEPIAVASDDDDDASSYVFVERVDDGENVTAQEIRVEIIDGKPRVWVDGKEVPADQLHHDHGRIKVLDGKGNVMRSVRVFEDGQGRGENRMRLRSGEPVEAHGNALAWRRAAEDVEAPPVMLGVYMEEPGEALRRHLQLSEGKTTLVSGVYEGLPAAKAGIEQYDIIIAINGDENAGPSQVRAVLKEKQPGDEIDFRLIHNGERRSATVKLEKYNPESMNRMERRGEPVMPSMPKEIFIPGQDDDEFIMIPRGRGGEWRFDSEEVHRAIQEAIEQAMRGTEQFRREAPEKLHEHLEAGRSKLEHQMSRLEERMEQLEQLLEQFAEKLHEEHEHNHDDDA